MSMQNSGLLQILGQYTDVTDMSSTYDRSTAQI